MQDHKAFAPIDLSARRFALAWRAVQAAASTDSDRPQLNRTTLIEHHGNGVRLVSTDSYLLLWAWCPTSTGDMLDDFTAPDLDEAPAASVLVADPSGLPAALVKHLVKTTKLDGSTFDRKSLVHLEVGTFLAEDGQAQPSLSPDLDRPGLVIHAFGETVVAPIVEVEFPEWRDVARARPVKSAARVGLAPRYMTRLGGITVDDHRGLWFSFLGKAHGIAVDVPGWPSIHGRVMPLSDDDGPVSTQVEAPDTVDPSPIILSHERRDAFLNADGSAEDVTPVE